MRTICIVPPRSLTLCEADMILKDLARANITISICNQETRLVGADLLLVLSGSSPDLALLGVMGMLARKEKVPIAYLSLPCTSVAEAVCRAISDSQTCGP